MTRARHHDLVVQQFGSTADAYVASAVHAQGADLDQLEQVVAKRPGARLLDLGCGGGHVSLRAAPYVGEVVAYDLAADMLAAVERQAARHGHANIVCRQGPAEHLPFPDAGFDVVMSRFSAHHWHDVAAGLAEARRVLKPGGVAAFADVVTPGTALLDTWLQSLELIRDPSHARNLSVAEWRAAMARAGFAVHDVTTRRLRLDFPSWVARMGTPAVHIETLRSLHRRMPHEVAAHFALEGDGSFTVDTMVLTAARQPEDDGARARSL
jgi:SAM-dependent methyltransferase